MSNKAKHMERSHKTHGKNDSVFRGFEVSAIRTEGQKAVRKQSKTPLIERVKNLFRRHQDK